MNCYQCGCRLTDNDFCTNCGADVSRYKRIILLSNKFYNNGLEKARVRDLSGSIVCLKQSLKMNKNNIEARNLLGLAYFEIGETVSALGEWVISKNIQPSKNIADDYINIIQANPSRLDTINQTIKKYNQALTYCKQDSLDLAVIQLKKVLSLNPKYVQAHQLLALLYMNIEEWDKARRELLKCTAIDTNNTTTLRYLKAVNVMQNVDAEIVTTKKKKDQFSEEEPIHVAHPKSKDVMLKPIDEKEPNGMQTLLNIIIGTAIGIAIAWFLILPARINQVKSSTQSTIDGYIETLSGKNEEVQNLTDEKNDLANEIASLELSLNGYSGTDEMMTAYERLLYACYLYYSPDSDELAVAEALNQIQDSDYANGTENYRAVYDSLKSNIGSNASKAYYNQAMDLYNQENYEDSIPQFLLAVEYNAEDVEALYNLANAYRLNENVEEAIAAYTQLIEKFPNSSRVSRANKYLKAYEQ